ncbi:MAG: SixA phosphatase family protein [Solirubrobacteraceae bacterium]
MTPVAKCLLLLRHAKSSWDDPTLSDHDRPLAPRGRRAAKRISAHLADQDLSISLVLCSSAQRARETVDLVAPSGEIRLESGLYGASAHQLLERLRRLPEDAETVMLVGHNPAMQELAIELAPGSELSSRKFPTGALATLSFVGPWAALEPGGPQLDAFVIPRELD